MDMQPHPLPKTIQDTHGFTVVELVATLAVVALLISAAIPALSVTSSRTALRNEALALKLFLERAYIVALGSRSSLRIDCDKTMLAAHNEHEEILATHQIGRGASLRLDSIPDRRVLFHPSISASPATLELTKGSQRCLIIISLRGRVRISC